MSGAALCAAAPLRLPDDTRLRATLFPLAARQHPGKLHLGLLGRLANWYALAGARVLDPLAGAGGALYLTQAPWGCHVLCNELEAQWVAAAREAWAHLGRAFTTTGTATIRWGDARTLAARLRPPVLADALITSPPYAETLCRPPSAGIAAYYARKSGLFACASYDALVTSPPYMDTISHQRHGPDYHPGKSPTAGGDATYLRRGYDAPAGGLPVQGVRNPAQIGNLRGKRYAAAMAEVWAATVPLVRAGGLVMVVVKNKVQDNAPVDIVGLMAQQLEALGCVQIGAHPRAVPPNAYHNIRRKNNPAALVIDTEWALVFRTPGGAA